MTSATVGELFVDARCELGESPVWDEATGNLVWVDVVGCRIHIANPRTGRTEIDTPAPVGAVAVRQGGGLVAALEDGFWLLDAGSTMFRRVATVEADQPGTRFNDGKCDPSGRFWAGTMAYDETSPLGSLYRLESDYTVECVIGDVIVSNGLDWSPDGDTMYYVDTPRFCIDAFDFDVLRGKVTHRRTFVAIDPRDGSPDGLTVDAAGDIWVALWGGGMVHRYGPNGLLKGIVEVPVSRVTSCTFGGQDLRDLYITTAWEGLSDADRTSQPTAGGIYRCRPGVVGRPAQLFAG